MLNIFKTSVLLSLLFFNACIQNEGEKDERVKVTIIELGSVRCIPCKKMKEVIKHVKEKYPTQVKTVFYDVLTDEGKPYAEEYHINLIPTQVFLDTDGNEYYRHEGYFSLEELDKVIQLKLGTKDV